MIQQIVKSHPLIESVIDHYTYQLGDDLEKYRNHVYRIFNYCIYLDDNPENEIYAIAGIFHDLGIWTHHTFDYLAPSIADANEYLTASGQQHLSNEIELMIEHHHKLTAYKGKYERRVESFRKADWTDVSMSTMHFEIPRSYIRKVKKQFPYHGFHLMLAKLFCKHFVKHPLSPLPMFKK